MLQLALAVHVLGACVWTGGHLVLSLTVLPRALRANDPSIVSNFEAGYERLGIPSLLAQVITGLYLAHRLVPEPARWVAPDSPLAAHVTAKLALLALTLALAIHARTRLIPSLSASNLRTLAWHIVAVTVLAVAMVLVGVGLRTGGLV